VSQSTAKAVIPNSNRCLKSALGFPAAGLGLKPVTDGIKKGQSDNSAIIMTAITFECGLGAESKTDEVFRSRGYEPGISSYKTVTQKDLEINKQLGVTGV